MKLFEGAACHTQHVAAITRSQVSEAAVFSTVLCLSRTAVGSQCFSDARSSLSPFQSLSLASEHQCRLKASCLNRCWRPL